MFFKYHMLLTYFFNSINKKKNMILTCLKDTCQSYMWVVENLCPDKKVESEKMDFHLPLFGIRENIYIHIYCNLFFELLYSFKRKGNIKVLKVLKAHRLSYRR
jgi:hypothetical protein